MHKLQHVLILFCIVRTIPTGENGPTFLDFPLFLGIFQWDEPTKRVPLTNEREIREILTKWKATLERVILNERALKRAPALSLRFHRSIHLRSRFSVFFLLAVGSCSLG